MEIVLTALLSFAVSLVISYLLTSSDSSKRKYFARGYTAGWNDHSACARQHDGEGGASK